MEREPQCLQCRMTSRFRSFKRALLVAFLLAMAAVVSADRQVTNVHVNAGVAPNVTGISPGTGAVGATVVISGFSFGATQGTSTVTFNGTPVTSVTSWAATSVTVLVPAGA